jgi:hypothetical protein
MELANNIAKVSWNEAEARFELRILNQLKAFTNGADRAEHEAAKPELITMAKEKGYTVIGE